MGLFTEFYFFVVLFFFLVPAVVLGLAEKPLRLYRDILTIVFVGLAFMDNYVHLFFFLCYIVLSIYTVRILLYFQQNVGKSELICEICVLTVLVPLIVAKYGKFISITGFGFLGISYICFRVIQVLLEVYDGLITDVNLIRFVEFVSFFPALSSGPIDRSRRFEEDNTRVWTRNEYIKLLSDGITKIIIGFFYKFVCSDYCYKLETELLQSQEVLDLLTSIKYSYAYGFYLFFDFAGYSLMAIGTAYVLGIRLPDNFNKPFMSIDIKDFWNRWHISLSHWFRDFVFTRIVIFLMKKKVFRNRTNIAIVGYVINMTIMGLWHGVGIQYLIYGLYHGMLLAVDELYKKSWIYKRIREYKVYKVASWFVTLNLVMFGFLIFSGYFNHIIKEHINGLV